MTGPDFYLTTPAGVVYALLGVGYGWSNPTDDQGRPVEPIEGYRSPQRPLQVLAASPIQAVTFTSTKAGPVTGYDLADPDRESVRLPLHITAEAHAELTEEDQYLYRARRDPGEDEVHTIDVSGARPWPTEATPRPEDIPEGARWVPAEAWLAIFGHPGHDHMIPGHLVGFHAAASALLEAHPNTDKGWGSTVSWREYRGTAADVSFRFHIPMTETERKRRQRLKRPLWETRRIRIVAGPDTVQGATLADAIAAWSHRLASLAAQVPEPSVICATCGGSGLVERPPT